MQILLQLCSGKNVIVPTYRFFILPLDSVTEKKILMKILMVHYYDLGWFPSIGWNIYGFLTEIISSFMTFMLSIPDNH